MLARPLTRAVPVLGIVWMLVACGAVQSPVDPGPRTPPVDSTTAPAGPTGPFVVGQTLTDAREWIEYLVGDAPLILIAPHGGSLTPSDLPDRACSGCVTVNDSNTQQLARAIADAFEARTGRRPHLVANRLHRRKFDANRELGEASGGQAALVAPWRWLHAAIDSASAQVSQRWQRGLVIDLHGHGHAIQRLELGYLLTAEQLRQSDSVLAQSGVLGRSSIARLLTDARSSREPVAVLRGAGSLGTLLAARGIPTVPSAETPAPLAGEPYFNGGYNTQRHGSREGGALDAVQIESHFAGIRDTPSNRAAFAESLTSVLVEFFATEYGWRP